MPIYILSGAPFASKTANTLDRAGASGEREIGGHAAVAPKGVCLRKDPGSPSADPEGDVPFGNLVLRTFGFDSRRPAPP